MSLPYPICRPAALVAIAALVGSANLASATPLIAFTDGSPNSAAKAFLSDTSANWAVSWTQTTASSDVTLSAILSTNVGATSANWYVADTIGPATTNANVVFSGSYSLTSQLPSSQTSNFNTAPRTVLGTGLNFGAGTYYLVLDGPAGSFQNNAEWIGDFTGVGTTLAPGFSVGGYSFAASPNSFAPASAFVANTSGLKFVFELAANTVPLPGTLPLFGLGLLALGLTRRYR